MTTMSGMHVGARHFSLAARESVAAGDAFDIREGGEFRRASDRRNLLAALLVAEGKEMQGPTAGGGFAARQLGYHPDNWQWHTVVRELCHLGELGDEGRCRTTAALRATLLGEGGAL